MPNEFYNHGSIPAENSPGSSAEIRAEFDSVQAGFAKMPAMAINGGKIVKVNAGGTALETKSSDAEAADTIHSAASKATPVDADEFGALDSAATFRLKKITFADLKAAVTDKSYVAQDFRLSLASGTPMAYVTGASTIYCVPYTGNRIGLYNGTTWANYATAEFSLALGTLSANKPYDVFCYLNAGVPTLEFLAWTNDTTKATALAYNSGILVKSGDATRRYLGSFYTTSATTTELSNANLYLWNYYNRLMLDGIVADGGASYTYTTAIIRQSRGSASNQVNFILGVGGEDFVIARQQSSPSSDTVGVGISGGIGIDSVTSFTLGAATDLTSATVGGVLGIKTQASVLLTAGKHYAASLERSVATGTTTWHTSSDKFTYAHIGLTMRG